MRDFWRCIILKKFFFCSVLFTLILQYTGHFEDTKVVYFQSIENMNVENGKIGHRPNQNTASSFRQAFINLRHSTFYASIIRG